MFFKKKRSRKFSNKTLRSGTVRLLILKVRCQVCCWSITNQCLTLCDPRDSSPPGSTVPGTLQARTLEWVAISFSNAWKRKVKVKSLSRVLLLATPWTAAHQAPLSMGFSRQEYWSGVPSPSPQERFSCVQFSQYFWSDEVFILFSFQNDVFKYSSLAVLSFNTWNISSHFLLA